MARIKEHQRVPRLRKRNPIIFIICEGSKTEILYFRHFNKRNGLVEVRPIHSKYTSAKHLVMHANSIIEDEYSEADGDSVWCVFDRDENSDRDLAEAKRLAHAKGYNIAFSNPAFELWFLYHFVERPRFIADAKAVCKKLNHPDRLLNYSKKHDYFFRIKLFQAAAVQSAKRRIAELAVENIEPISRDSNPCSTVGELVEYLLNR